jgi:hypothetical protein
VSGLNCLKLLPLKTMAKFAERARRLEMSALRYSVSLTNSVFRPTCTSDEAHCHVTYQALLYLLPFNMDPIFDNYLANTLNIIPTLRAAMELQGLTSFATLRSKNDAKIDKVIGAMRRPGGAINAANTRANLGVTVSEHLGDQLKELAYGLRHCVRVQILFDPETHDEAWFDRLREFREIEESPIKSAAPAGKMTNSAKARESLDDVLRDCDGIRGCDGARLSRCLRENEAPSEAPAGGWTSIEAELIARAPLSGEKYHNDNRAVYGVDPSIFGNTVANAYVKPYERTQGGQAAYKAVYAQYVQGQLLACKRLRLS